MDKLRLDKWLWAARFYKTRSLASDAVEGGRVHLNGSRTKPAREVRPGDVLTLTAGETWTVAVKALSDRRGPAHVARLLYEETPESLAAREMAREARRFVADPAADRHGRPTKRDRRRMDLFGGC